MVLPTFLSITFISPQYLCYKTSFSSIQAEVAAEEEGDEEPVLSEQELNTLGAKLVKAELLGNNEMAQKLKDQLAQARAARLRHLVNIFSIF